MELKTLSLGLTDYRDGRKTQEEIFRATLDGKIKATLITLSHNPVITLGRTANPENILAKEQELLKDNIQICKTERGGDVTYHGPGQLTAYPIFNLEYFRKDIHWFLRSLEAVTVGFLQSLGIDASARTGLTGVWVKDKKIASIGISVRRWITYHGLSINVKEKDLENFRHIRPCGMDIKVTSAESILKKALSLTALKEKLATHFKDYFFSSPVIASEAKQSPPLSLRAISTTVIASEAKQSPPLSLRGVSPPKVADDEAISNLSSTRRYHD